MASRTVGSSGPLLTLGRVDLVRVQVGYRASPDDRPRLQFLLDLPVAEADPARAEKELDERMTLAALEPALYARGGAPRHYSLHQHRWHSSWGASPGALELGLLVTTGPRSTTADWEAWEDSATRAFRGLIEVVGRPEPTSTSREAAVSCARRGAATAYSVDPDTLALRAEEHRPAQNSWALSLRATAGEEYDVLVGFVDGYAGSVRVSHRRGTEVSASLGSE